ncbi:MAG: TM2 domain-containing protein [Ruminococcaceae bacterium]|nr:TM2 domain-containing protein [Oscillospiraceae bacterium]
MKFCSHCGGKIPEAAVICTLCGCQVEQIKQNEQPSIIINNANTNTNANMNVNAAAVGVRMRNKWVAFCLCLFLGYFGAHKFYEGKAGMGLLYLFTGGLFGIGWFIDCISLLCKPNPYYVH